eukprot:Unigene2249_Nuclearia_a/m.7001 Unigene2249_Nuclearia_a/g.7001  ORF Unigene2249_Nuclearia_a/g.7001 Unigene2249_Nuclearia_a/m.7001 type:complete len:248 (-) Unigene2249_Nuclearia_a:122-865(-)
MSTTALAGTSDAAAAEEARLQQQLASGPDYDRWWIVFRKVDRSRDNSVTKKELLRAAERGLQLSKKEINKIMREADEDGSKELSFNEFYKYMSEGGTLEPRISTVVLNMFTKYDHDNDGLLSRKDFLKAIKNDGLRMSKKEVSKMFASTGHDTHEGKLTLSEFANMISGPAKKSKRLTPELEEYYINEFAKLDVSMRGELSREDFKKLVAGMSSVFTNEELDTFFKEADANADGVVSYEEFLDLMSR